MRRRLFLFAHSVIAILLFAHTGVCQSSETALVNQRINISLARATFMQTLSVLAVEHRVPIGLERDADYWHRTEKLMSLEEGKIKWKEGTIFIKSGTLKEILDSLVAQEPLYQWEVRDGVINVYPARSRDGFLKQLLETRIKTFSPEKGMNKFQIRDAILDLPEIRALLETEKVEALKRSYPTRRSIYADNQVELGISNTNVRGILNRVARDSEHKMWVVDRIGDKREGLEISF